MTVGAILTLGLGEFGSVNLLPTLGYGVGSGTTEIASRRRRRKKLYVVKFDGEQIGIESAQELKQLARLADSIPVVKLIPAVDYGPKIQALKNAIIELDAERNRQIEMDDEDIFILLH